MRLYTSYFAKSCEHPQAVCITALPAPTFFKGRCLPELGPPKGLLRRHKAGQVKQDQFIEEFLDHLGTLDSENILSQLSDGDVLICYEGSDKFCHRHIVAEWLASKGIEVRELK